MRSSEYFYSESSAAGEAAKIKKFSAKKLLETIAVADAPQNKMPAGV
jgi:hypothetical protein